jgi:pyruvate/2-oxoglutarate dehydrogenase complex dihydrolipoamide dehydrogenase (E3) component
VGGEPVVPPIQGIDGDGVTTAVDVFELKVSPEGEVVVIGGGEVGAEVGLFLAEKGCHVTIIEMRGELAPDSAPVFYRVVLLGRCESQPNLDIILNATCKAIDADGVTYVGSDGKESRVDADSVVVAAGMCSMQDSALVFADTGLLFYMIGDCETTGNIQKSIRSGYSIASIL